MSLLDKSPKESHAQRVLRLQSEFRARYDRYRGDPKVWPLLERLMLLRKDIDNNLSGPELDALDRILAPLRRIKERFKARIHY